MITILVVGIGIARTNAAVELTLSGTPGSSRIDFFLSGTGTIQSGLQLVSLVGLKLSGISFDVLDANFSPITSFPVTGNATLVNTSTLEAATLDRVFLIDGGPVAGVDEVTFNLSTRVNFVPGQFYSLSGSGTFDVASAGSFGAFNLGSGTATPFGLDFATVAVIPEPHSASQFTIGLVLVLLLRHRILPGAPPICPRQQQPNEHLSRCTE